MKPYDPPFRLPVGTGKSYHHKPEQMTKREQMMKMRWLYRSEGIHAHVKVYMNGAFCGDLCFRREELSEIILMNHATIEFVKEDELPKEP